jgi:5,10-methylenetetrahydrofolate reductase
LGFLRTVEVFPPLFPEPGASSGRLYEEKVEEFVEGVRVIRRYSDLVLVASVRKPGLVQLPPVEASAVLTDRVGVQAAPVLVVRDFARSQLLSSVITALSLGVRSFMLAWGDDVPKGSRPSRPDGYAGLSQAIRDLDLHARRAGFDAEVLSPVDLSSLGEPRGSALARSRLRAGARLLLAQPPTTDAAATFDLHARLLERRRLRSVTMLGVFPFRSAKDVADCERRFGWKLPLALHRLAKAGPRAVIEEARGVVRRLRDEGFPGVYVSTRGDPSVAERMLS